MTISTYNRRHFLFGAWAVMSSPFYIARRALRRELTELLPECSGRLLDLGCGTKPYESLALNASEYVGLEIDTPEARKRGGADVYYDGGKLPFDDASFDSVFCSQVFEHVFTPLLFLSEINRVLKPGGRLLITVPFVWDEHEQPVDFARYSSFGLRAILEQAGFGVLDQRKTCPNLSVFGQLGAGWVYKICRHFPRWLRGGIQISLIAPISITGVAAAWALPANPDLYLDNVILARKSVS